MTTNLTLDELMERAETARKEHEKTCADIMRSDFGHMMTDRRDTAAGIAVDYRRRALRRQMGIGEYNPGDTIDHAVCDVRYGLWGEGGEMTSRFVSCDCGGPCAAAREMYDRYVAGAAVAAHA